MVGKVSRFLTMAVCGALVTGCNSLGGGDAPAASSSSSGQTAQIMPLAPANPSSNDPKIGTATTASGAVAPVVQGACPQIFMKDSDAIYRVGAKGGRSTDPKDVVFQASFGDYTRQCGLNDQNLTMTVVAQLRLVSSTGGPSGRVNLPVRISVVDGTDVISSEVVNFAAEVGPSGNGQALFRKDDIRLPVGSGALLRVNIGFDQADGKATAKKRKG